jgi:hypothetical protein
MSSRPEHTASAPQAARQARALRFPATVLVFLCLLWVKAVYPPSSGLADPDFYWHITTGRWIAEHGAIPATDQFSWSMPGTPYRITQWLGEYLMAVLYDAGGLHATKAASVALAGLTIWLGWSAARLYLTNSMTALCLSILCNLVNLVTPLRPQLFSFLGMALFAYLLAGWLKARDWRYLVPLPLAMAAWVNLHGGFVVGGLLIAVVFIAEFAQALAAGTLSLAKRHLAMLFAAGLATAGATLANPYGLGAWESVFLVSGLQSSAVIEEWRPVQITTEMGWFLLFMALPYVLALIANRRPPLTAVVVGGVFLFFAATANRQVAFAGAIMPFVLAALLAGAHGFAAIQTTVTNPSHPMLFTGIVLLLIATFPALQAKGDHSWQSTLNGQFPVVAHEFMAKNRLTDRVMTDIPEANYLMFHGIKSFIDSRMDLYLDKFFFDYHIAMRGAPGWESFLERHKPQTLLLRHEVALKQIVLASGRWKTVHEDDRYAVLVPATPALERIPAVEPRPIVFLDDNGHLIRTYRP